MKQYALLLPVFLLLVFTSCKKENHSIRVRNLYQCDLVNVSVGNVEIGTVVSGLNSSYHPISTGDFNLSGSSTCGGSLQSSGSVNGTAKHHWTLTVNSSGIVSIQEDL